MSDIIGEGYGSDHDWKHSHTSMGRQTLYICGDCDHHFWHDYPRTPDIFEAMMEAKVPEKCTGKEVKASIDLTPDQLAFIRQAAARWRMDEAGPLMLEALRMAELGLDDAITALEKLGYEVPYKSTIRTAYASVRAAIAAAE